MTSVPTGWWQSGCRLIRVDLRDARTPSIRRGDRVRIRGDWERNGAFEAERVELARHRRH